LVAKATLLLEAAAKIGACRWRVTVKGAPTRSIPIAEVVQLNGGLISAAGEFRASWRDLRQRCHVASSKWIRGRDT